jgi:asparagine synthase (glutamine-hydrolysing)
MDAVSHYLTTGRNIFGDKTLFENIFTLRPGHCLTLDLKSMSHSVRRYWKRPVVPSARKEKISFEEASGKVKELVEDAVRRRLISDVPVGAFLSGGLDSAVICTVADRYSSYKLPLFCAGTDDEKSNEFVFS